LSDSRPRADWLRVRTGFELAAALVDRIITIQPFLAISEADNLTQQTFNVDGGNWPR
jgi:hypothetical protein